jgi:hypothetical protein
VVESGFRGGHGSTQRSHVRTPEFDDGVTSHYRTRDDPETCCRAADIRLNEATMGNHRRLHFTFALIGWAAVAGAAQGQALPSRVDVALYAGAARTSAWLEAGGDRFRIGTNPGFASYSHFWVTPQVGGRLHLGYVPSDLPTSDDQSTIPRWDGSIHNWFYDASVVFRPFALADPANRLSSLYLFVGGGGFTPKIAGNESSGCLPPFDTLNACLPFSWRDATRAQATAGLGAALIPITPALRAFVEGAVHRYGSPFRMGEAWTGRPPCDNPDCLGESRSGTTMRLVGGLQLAFGSSAAVPLAAASPPPSVAHHEERPLVICVLSGGFPRYVEVMVRPGVGDTIYVTEQGLRRPLRSAFPAPPSTASGVGWFERHEPIFIDGREYVRFGPPQESVAGDARRVGEFRGVPLFARDGDRTDGVPTTLFVPVQDGCVFQQFQMRERIRGTG